MLSSRKVNRVRRKMRSVSKRSFSKSRLSKGRTISKRLSRRRLKSKLSRKFTKVGGKSKLRSRHKLTKCRRNNRKNNRKTKRRTRFNKKQSGGKPLFRLTKTYLNHLKGEIGYTIVFDAINEAIEAIKAIKDKDISPYEISPYEISHYDISPYEIKKLFEKKFKELIINKAFSSYGGQLTIHAKKMYDEAEAEMYKLSEQLEKEARDQYIVYDIDTLNVSVGTILDDVNKMISEGFPSLISKPSGGRYPYITYLIDNTRPFQWTDENILEKISSRALDLMAVCSQNLKLLKSQQISECITRNISVMNDILELGKLILSKISEIYGYKTTSKNWYQMAKIIEELDPPIKDKIDSGSVGLSYSTFTQNWYLHKFNKILGTPIDILSFIDAFNKADDGTKTKWKTTIDQNRKPNNSNSLYEQRQVVLPLKVPKNVQDPRNLTSCSPATTTTT